MTNRHGLLLTLTCCLSFSALAIESEQLFTEQPTVTPALANNGGWPVGVKTIQLVNADQLNTTDFTSTTDRALTVEVWYPARAPKSTRTQRATYEDQTRSGASFSLQGEAVRNAKQALGKEQFPLVVISHGYTGYRSIMFYLAEHLASHGYVVASIDHTDSTNAEIDFATAPGAGFVSTLLNRARDQQFVLEALNNGKTHKLATLIDPERAAVIGYSMGGYGALNTVGGCYDFSVPFLQGMGIPAEAAPSMTPLFNICAAGRESADPRWRAMIAISPWGGEQNVHSAEALAALRMPMMFVAGDQDDISGYEDGIKKLYEQTGSTEKVLMVYENARHNTAAHPAPKVAYSNDLDIGHYFEPSWNSETITRINEHMTLAFLNCHVKADEKACGYLPAREDITQHKQSDGKLSPPWPGFSDRWGAGVRFIRGGE